VTGLLALMLLTHARRQTRTTAAGGLVPLDEQDRTKWDRRLIGEGIELVKASLADSALGPYQHRPPSPPRTPTRPRPRRPTGHRCTPLT
jgi:predicted RNA polymerase sigma factor